jgi:acyl-coenzyme A thioesterase PaaI-like protein
MNEKPFQKLLPGNHCWGCGIDTVGGLDVQSFWSGDDEATCTWMPSPQHMAGPRDAVNGGIIASVIDCHCICTAAADAYRQENRPIGEAPILWFATGTLNVRYYRPTPIDRPMIVRAQITERTPKRTNLTCTVYSDGKKCVIGQVVAVRVPPTWVTTGTAFAT